MNEQLENDPKEEFRVLVGEFLHLIFIIERIFSNEVRKKTITRCKEIKARLFEPYFSTKKTGTGLGLVIAKQIVDEHFGKIYVEENLPKGTVFIVEIPAIKFRENEDKII